MGIKKGISLFLLGLSLAFSTPGIVSPDFGAIQHKKEVHKEREESYAEKSLRIEEFIKKKKQELKLNGFYLISPDFNPKYFATIRYCDSENKYPNIKKGFIIGFITTGPELYYVFIYDEQENGYGNIDAVIRSWYPPQSSFRCDITNTEGIEKDVLKPARELQNIAFDIFTYQIKNRGHPRVLDRKILTKDVDSLFKDIMSCSEGEVIEE